MPTLEQIKAKIKAEMDATGEFGSVYTEDVERLERPLPAAITMFHDGGSQEPESNTTELVTTNLLLYLLVPKGTGPNADVDMQRTTDKKLEVTRRVLRKNPTLATDGVPLVFSCRPQAWDIVVEKDAQDKPVRMETEIRLAVTYEED